MVDAAMGPAGTHMTPKRRVRFFPINHAIVVAGMAIIMVTTAVAAPPVADDDSVLVHHGQKIWIPVLANDSGNFEPSHTEVVQPPQHGSVTVGDDGRIRYANNEDDTSATDSFTYRDSGVDGFSNEATVTITFSTDLRLFVGAPSIPSNSPGLTVEVTPAFGNLSFAKPVFLTGPPGDVQRLFVLEKNGLIKIIPDITSVTPTTVVFLNLPPIVAARGETVTITEEEGILGLAFHPDYAQNRYFYIFYTVRKANNQTYERLSRFTTKADDPNAADPASELILIEQVDRALNHNGGCLAFGPDGYLYVSLGDEGVANDFYSNGQKIDQHFFSGLLRIDVDKKPGGFEPNPHATIPRDGGLARYSVPPDNPFIGATTFNGLTVTTDHVRTEFWAVGLRNPWRFSFDPPTGELWLGDVGQDVWEEVNIITRGGNYGWPYREGNHNGVKSGPFGFVGDVPLHEYHHGIDAFMGYCVIGGFVYRGTALTNIIGDYLFGDYVTGYIWALHRNGANVSVQLLATSPGIVSFASNPATHEVLMTNYAQGNISQLTPVLAVTGLASNLSATGLFSDLSDLAPAPGVVRYSVNLPAWNDHAQSQYWFAMHDATSQFTWAADGPWTFPTGTIWVQQLDMEMTRDDPFTKRHIETRILVKTAAGAYGASYLWNEAQTDAILVPNEGATLALNLTVDGNPVVKTWRVPSRAECLQCHNATAGYALSFNTRQLNRIENMNSFVGNEIDLLRQYGYFTNEPGPSDTLPRYVAPDEAAYSFEARARSYLAVNCASCHQSGGGTGAPWDLRPELSLNLTALVNAAVANNANGDPDNRALVPGDIVHSVLYNRATASLGFTRMPPLGSYETDPDGAALLEAWIADRLPYWQNYDIWRAAIFAGEPPPMGDAEADDDGDGASNLHEFLAGTNPLDPVEIFQPYPLPNGLNLEFQFQLPLFRAFQIETSMDLIEWTPLDVAGNNGLPALDGNMHIVIPAPSPYDPRFYRLRLWEN